MTDDIRVAIFTGTRTRNRPTANVVHRELRYERSVAEDAGQRLVVAVGDCPTGVDGHVRSWCAKNLPREDWHVYIAEWGQFGKAAGPRRNRRMCAAHPDAAVCVGFPLSLEPDRSGTWDCLHAATALDIRLRVVGPEEWM